MIKVIRIVLDDHEWPNVKCSVQAGELVPIERISLYDTANSNFTPMVANALMFAVTDLVQNRGKPEPLPLSVNSLTGKKGKRK